MYVSVCDSYNFFTSTGSHLRSQFGRYTTDSANGQLSSVDMGSCLSRKHKGKMVLSEQCAHQLSQATPEAQPHALNQQPTRTDAAATAAEVRGDTTGSKNTADVNRNAIGSNSTPNGGIGSANFTDPVSHMVIGCKGSTDVNRNTIGCEHSIDVSHNAVGSENVVLHVTPDQPSQNSLQTSILESACTVSLVVRGLHDFYGFNPDDLSFKKDDRMQIDLSTVPLDWWLAKHMTTGLRGYIPRKSVVILGTSLTAQEWWMDVGREEAERMLLSPGNRDGTFLVREAEDRGSYMLSIRFEQGQSADPVVKHYRIQRLDNGRYYIAGSGHQSFDQVADLIRHFSGDDATKRLCTKLTEPCPRVRRPCRAGAEGEGLPPELDRSAIELGSQLGAGYFSQVWKGKVHGGLEVAVKIMRTSSSSSQNWQKEVEVMKSLQHPRLVRLLAICTRQSPVWIVMELMPHGSLLHFLHRQHSPTSRLLSSSDLLKMAAQVADGMHYLESRNLVHRDLRAANILVGGHYDVKVADFGLARFIQCSGAFHRCTIGGKLPIKWTAPEAGIKGMFSVQSDVWSFGVFLYELVTFGREPYPGMANAKVLEAVNEGYRMPKPVLDMGHCPDSVYDVMMMCWEHVPTDRPTFESLKVFFHDCHISTDDGH